MDKTYDHKKYEKDIYKKWEESGVFTPKIDPKKKPFTIILPPPNASGRMHTGNVLMISIEDLLIRWKRMSGYSALWVPGTDHAGIETQITFERELAEQGKSRLDYDRDTLYKKIEDFVFENKTLIENQIRNMGASVDWTRYKFTLDDDSVQTVINTFINLYKDGLVYRDEYMVNYCPRCGSTYADVEVKHKTVKTPLIYVRYHLVERKDSEPRFITVATVRPEPIFVDTHLAVNPNDESKKWLIGRVVKNPLTDKEMKIIADDFVDPQFGTGIVKMTPAHDKTDYETAKKHNLPITGILNIDGTLNKNAGELEGLEVAKARDRVIKILEEKGLIEKIDKNYQNSVGLCKGGHVIEPTIFPNWFIKVKTLKEPAHKVVKDGKVTIYPKWQEIKYHRWMETMHDWAISRQVVWGIRMPVWYKVEDNPNILVTFLGKDKKVKSGLLKDLIKKHSFQEISDGLQTLFAPKTVKYVISTDSPGDGYLQETDTFDTWFGSGQWPLIVLGYPGSRDFKYFYPTDVLETGWEILRLWVSRMIMFGLYLSGEVPFKDVYLHGMVRAIDGRKMSKSLGNVINPEEYLENYGADALRMGLISGTAMGKDFNFPRDKVIAYRNFANKIWNMARFIKLMSENNEAEEDIKNLDPNTLGDTDREILNELNNLIDSVNTSLEKYRFADAGEAVYHFMWNTLASKYIEDVKKREDKKVGLTVLIYAYKTSLQILHPFMPFVTEFIWQEMFSNEGMLVSSNWPCKVDL